jgi:hypothetical protein
MFGLLPILRGLFIGAIILCAVALFAWAVWRLTLFALKPFGVDWAELRAYRERRRIYLDQLRQLESQLPAIDLNSREFEQASETLAAYQASEPTPPQWAFWLRERS